MSTPKRATSKPPKPDVILVHRESILGTVVTVVRNDDFTLTATCRPGAHAGVECTAAHA